MKILVTGGTGFVGGHLVEKLLSRNDEVVCLCRVTSRTAHLKALTNSCNLSFAAVDICSGACSVERDFGALKDALREADYIYHLAGAIKARTARDYDIANADATRKLLELARDAGNKKLKRFVYLSSLAAVGPASGVDGVDEHSPCRPISDYGRSKLKGEDAVNSFKSSLPITILRPPAVYGPGDTGVLEFFKLISRGIKPKLNHQKSISLIYVKDLADAMIAAAESSRAVGQTYFVANKDYYSVNSILDIIKKSVGRKTVTITMPDSLIQAAAGIYEGVCGLFNMEPDIINSQKALELSQKYWICRSEKIKVDAGYEASFPVEKGLEATAQWYRANGWIRN